jgi:ERF superfamily
MHRSSESIAALAAALAKAQSELSNPEKSLVATIGTDRPREGARTFRYAPLSSGLDIIRKALGQQQIAIIQATTVDASAGTVNLTTVLAHASGEWIASDWPVCRLADTATPHRMGAALTYARRYALFTLVGIAGEDDLDGPDLNPQPQHMRVPQNSPRLGGNEKNGFQPTLDPNTSAALRDQLIGEVASLRSAAEAARWARTALAEKNRLTVPDARLLEVAFELRLSSLESEQCPSASSMSTPENADPSQRKPETRLALLKPGRDNRAGVSESPSSPAGIDKSVLPIGEPRRYRDKAHREFVASQACLICGRRPSDPHHLRFAQQRAMGRKVSDEFTVPLCRTHHREAHRSRNERAWWRGLGLDSLKIAETLWKRTRPADSEVAASTAGAVPTAEIALGQVAMAAPDAPAGNAPTAAGDAT